MFGGFLSWIPTQLIAVPGGGGQITQISEWTIILRSITQEQQLQAEMVDTARAHTDVQDGVSWRSYLNHESISSLRFLSDLKMPKVPVKHGPSLSQLPTAFCADGESPINHETVMFSFYIVTTQPAD